MPCASSHLSLEAARTKPSKLPRGCRPWPPQLAAENGRPLMFSHTGERALPDAHRGEVRRLQRGDVPLVDGVIGDAVEPDISVRPGLHARPFDAVVEIRRLARREMVDMAGRAAAAPRIDPHDDIAVRHP